ncbi:MAG: 23S rRNA (cytosine1962-C5)-methyltransferase [Desulforhopalus sp.]|jgi:23S rRNA (cytosine1962-C5)-methyltransferase
MELKKLQLKKNEERRLRAGHLWIYSNEVNIIETPLKQFAPGDQVRVISHDGKSLGTAYVNPKSLICARLISRKVEPLDQTLLHKRITQALTLRETLFKDPFYRLVYGESDLLPGLVVDRFGDHLSVQLNSAGMDVLKDEIVETLKTLLKPSSILLRNDSSMRNLEGMETEVVAAHGTPPSEVELIENGVKMLAPLYDGQKTGWFYDQRPNRAELGRFVHGKRVLDVFSYVGSFAVQAAAFGAKEVWSVDASRFALEMAEKNAQLNGFGDIFTGAEGDAFDVLKALRAEDEKFDVIVVDPPAFIKRKKDHKEGLRAYHRINELAMRLLPEDGILLSASCSMHLHRDDLLDVLRSGARKTGHHAQVLFEGMQGPDHPVHPAIAETKYLKAFIARLTHE